MQVNNLRMRNQRENSYEIDLVQEETKKQHTQKYKLIEYYLDNKIV